ncbi:12662_t:CDS:2, partial [Gigaspora rosea]
ETRKYIRTRWISEDFLPEDLKSTKVSQLYTLSDPEFTFIKKFLEKREQRRLSQNDLLLMDTIVPTNDFEIPTQYMALLESEIFSNNSSLNSSSVVWRDKLCTSRSPEKMQEVCNISEAFGRPPNYKLDIAEKTIRNVATVVDFFDLVKYTGEEDTIVVVDKYYSYNLNKDNKLHKSKEFKKGLVEHFETFIGNNNELYTTANTASNHCSEYRKCGQELISGLQPLSNANKDSDNSDSKIDVRMINNKKLGESKKCTKKNKKRSKTSNSGSQLRK